MSKHARKVSTRFEFNPIEIDRVKEEKLVTMLTLWQPLHTASENSPVDNSWTKGLHLTNLSSFMSKYAWKVSIRFEFNPIEIDRLKEEKLVTMLTLWQPLHSGNENALDDNS